MRGEPFFNFHNSASLTKTDTLGADSDSLLQNVVKSVLSVTDYDKHASNSEEHEAHDFDPVVILDDGFFVGLRRFGKRNFCPLDFFFRTRSFDDGKEKEEDCGRDTTDRESGYNAKKRGREIGYGEGIVVAKHDYRGNEGRGAEQSADRAGNLTKRTLTRDSVVMAAVGELLLQNTKLYEGIFA